MMTAINVSSDINRNRRINVVPDQAGSGGVLPGSLFHCCRGIKRIIALALPTCHFEQWRLEPRAGTMGPLYGHSKASADRPQLASRRPIRTSFLFLLPISGMVTEMMPVEQGLTSTVLNLDLPCPKGQISG